MNKKRYFILSPPSSPERTKELKEKASAYYGTKDYEETSDNEDLQKILKDILKDLANADCNASLLLTGMTLIVMSKSDSVYVSKDWEQYASCKFTHLLAFTHGVDLVYESV